MRDHFGRELTYGLAWRQSRSLAGFLRASGVRRGDRIAIHLGNRVEVAVAVFASAWIGAVFVVANSKLRPEGLRKICRQAEPSAVLLDETTSANREACEGIPLRIGIGDFDELALHGAVRWEQAVEHPPLEAPWPGIDLDLASLVFTSGSTGDPRGVALSHDNIGFAVAGIQDRLGYREGDVVGVFLPLAFDYGLYQIFLAARAACTVYLGDPGQVGPRLPTIMRREGITVLPAVPSIAAALIALARRGGLDLPALRSITNTGERLPPAHIEQLEGILPGTRVYVMYGLTECKRVSILLPEERPTRPESVGRALAGTEVYAVDESGRRLPPGETGELVVRGRHVAHGYWRAPDESAGRFRKTAPENPVELYTGDSGSVDAEGFLYFAARRDELIKHRGHRISPLEIEIEACAIAGVREAAVVKGEDDDLLHLFVCLDAAIDSLEILRGLGETLEPAKVPDTVNPIEGMPKTLNGKIDRKALVSRLRPTGSGGEPERPAASAEQ